MVRAILSESSTAATAPEVLVQQAHAGASVRSAALWAIARVSTVRVLLVHSPQVSEPREPGQTEWFHISLPLRGSFLWSDSLGDVLAGPNHVLFMPSGRDFRIAHPLESDLSLVIVPRRAEAERIAHLCCVDPTVPSLRILSGPAQLASHRLVWGAWAGLSDLHLEELALALLQHLRPDGHQPIARFDASVRRTLTRAKEYLHAHYEHPVKLADVAAAVGTNSVYLTNLFKTKEGVPLHKYLLELRLVAGLARLPHAPDLSALAHDLGFSSHSHLSSAFKTRFARSPSEIRNAVKAPPTGRRFDRLPLCAARSGGPSLASCD